MASNSHDAASGRRGSARAEPMIICPRCDSQVPVRLITGPLGAKELECPGCRAMVPV